MQAPSIGLESGLVDLARLAAAWRLRHELEGVALVEVVARAWRPEGVGDRILRHGYLPAPRNGASSGSVLTETLGNTGEVPANDGTART